MKLLFFVALPVLAAVIAHATGLTVWLGAHPWWSSKVIWIGLPVGIGLAAAARVLKVSETGQIIGFLALTLGAFMVASVGKTRFAASYAEDALAGQFWYFGWIATCALAAATLAAIAAFGAKTR